MRVAGGSNDELASRVTTHLLALAKGSDDPVNMYISSPGVHVESGDMVHDMIKFIRPKVRTIGSGWVASAGALIFVGADRADRYCLPNTRFMIHQPLGGFHGQASDIDIHAKEILLIRDRLNKIMASHTGQPLDVIQGDTDRDNFMGSQQAVEYGLIDQVLKTRNIEE